jgi:hypothetical protein
MNELTEAKLRALGVSLGDEDPPPPPSISPNPAGLNRRATITQYPPPPFSPPVPTPSASSAHGMQQFPFSAQNPTGGSGASPVPFNGNFNPHQPRQSVSIPTSQPPFGFMPPQQQPSPRDVIFQQQGMHRVSPSLSTSPFSPGAFQPPMLHQRHQSLQFPQLPHQHFMQPSRASPRLQELREADEEEETKSVTPDPAPKIRHNASNSLQKEIDEAEYHLEEQFRSQLEHDEDYSPHNEHKKVHAAQSSHETPVQFAPQAPRFEGAIDKDLVLHHPRPHSRGHSLSQKYFGEDDMRAGAGKGGFNSLRPIQDDDKAGHDDVDTNPSNLGTPVLTDFGDASHERNFSTMSNPWKDVQSTSRRPSHSSKPSFSKLNVAAPEFKFNPTSSFQPGQFNFGSNTFQPAVFQGPSTSNPPDSDHSNQFSPPAGPSRKINVNAPVFSPGSSEFSFSAAGAPIFRPNAPAFTPASVAGSVTSPVLSGSESGKMASSIFGSIDLNIPDILKPPKKSKAIPIVRPASRTSNKGESGTTEDEDGRVIDETRVKRPRGATADDEGSRMLDGPSSSVNMDTKGVEEERPARDSGISSTILSDSTDGKDNTSVSEVSAEHDGNAWAPFEFRSEAEVSAFNTARPFGDDGFMAHGHQKSLSASAKPFVPGTTFTTDDEFNDKEDTPVPGYFERSDRLSDVEAEVSTVEEDQSAEDVPQQSIEREPSPIVTPAEDENHDIETFVDPSPVVKKGLAASRFAASPSPPKGLGASKHAQSPSPVSEVEASHSPLVSDTQRYSASPVTAEDLEDTQEDTQDTIPQFASPRTDQDERHGDAEEPTFEEIDAVMEHINQNDPDLGVKKTVDSPRWHQPSPTRHIPVAAITNESPQRSQLHFLRGEAPSPSPRHYHLPLGVHPPLHTTETLENPFVDPPISLQLSRLNTSESQAASDDWEQAFSDEEQVKLDSRANFFDGKVNELVGAALQSRLDPLERTLEGIQQALASLSGLPASSRRERRSVSAEVQESDADDEDDEPVPRRSMSPRRDKRMEQIRVAVLDAFAVQQRSAPPLPPLPSIAQDGAPAESMVYILKAMEEMKQQFSESLHLDFRAEDLRNVVEEAVESRLPANSPQPVVVEGQDELTKKFNELQVRYAELEQRHRLEEAKASAEAARAAELERQLWKAETKVEAEIMNRSTNDQRFSELEGRLSDQEAMNEAEVHLRRAAEDRLSEVQRLLRISSEEEVRLREALEEKDERLKILDATHSKNTMRLALLEAAAENSQKEKMELENRVDVAEADVADLRRESARWRSEADRTTQLSQRQSDELYRAMEENKQLHMLIDTLGTQLNENERLRDNYRSKFLSLQQDMENSMRHITEENARRAKAEQTMLARQEVLDAKLQAESKTRERLETELERLEAGERQGMKAVNEAKRLDALLGEMRTENHKLQQSTMRYQAEFQEARESGAREVQRTRESMQAQVEDANNQVNVVREELEDEISRLRAQLDQAKLDADTVRSRYDMLMEDAHQNRKGDIEEAMRKHQDEIEDMQARFERQLNNTVEDAQRSESNLLERLSISTSKCEHLQDRVTHLEEKLEIAREAARAAVQAAKASGVVLPSAPPVSAPAPPQHTSTSQPQGQPQTAAAAAAMQLPEKISPQALRESIMVLQEQVQERELRIEELEQTVAKLDPESKTKIAKRDDEIVWLRELLAVRHSDLQDIITALGRNDYDQDRVRDAAIRLKANLQMEQQERERAMNGGSAVKMPNIAASLRDAATPRVAQAVGPLAAAWGNWRKGGTLSNVAPSTAKGADHATPRRDSPGSQSSFLSGLLTPPASGVRQNSPSGQPTAFSNTGRRFTAQDLANRPKAPPQRQARGGSPAPKQQQAFPSGPQTPPMMRQAAYDDDAMAADDFDDFFDE